MIRLIFFSLIIASSFTVNAQTYKQYEKSANEAYDAGDYYKASRYFKKALELKKLDSEIHFKYATSLRLFNDYENASTAYKEVLRLDGYRNFPRAEYWLGIMNKYMGNYDIAIRHLSNFKDRYKMRDFYVKSARHEIESLTSIDQIIKDTSDVAIDHLSRKINTKWSDFAAGSMGDSILQISSLRPDKKDSLSNSNLFRSRFYAYEKKRNRWNYLTDLFSGLNDIGKDVANGSFSPDGIEFYFTICDETEFGEIHCRIYRSEYLNSKWSKPEELGINLPCCTSTQPSIKVDNSGRRTLYFASDRAGSIGGMDIWYSVEDDNGRFVSAENMGEMINTIGDEITPHYDDDQNRLYFSSNWHQNLGGYDIFYSEFVDDKWSAPKNAGIPVNTSYNDIYFVTNKGGRSGYLASNRPGSIFLKGQTCCNDIFSWKLPFDSTILTEEVPDTFVTDSLEIVINDQLIPDTTGYSILPEDSPVIAYTDTITGEKDQKITTTSLPDPDDNLGRMKSMLPVTLYFHNDEPECCTMKDTTTIDYKTSYQDYASLLPAYIRQYQKLFSEKEVAKKEMEEFFEEKVDKGMIDLIRFCVLLQSELESGKTISVTIEGYCSPLAVNPYNINLAKRRIVSLKDYIRKFRKGVFADYLASGKLILKKKPFGEELADPNVSDDPSDIVKSVYHIQAALERKVEIIAIDVRQ